MFPRPRRALIAGPLLVLAVAPPLHAAPPPAEAGDPDAAGSERSGAEVLAAATRAWELGDWARVQGLLTDSLAEPGRFADPDDLRDARILLADAMLQDPDLPPGVASSSAVALLLQVIEATPEWEPPSAVYATAFYEALALARAEREQIQAQNCEVERASCVADLAAKTNEKRRLQVEYDALKLRYDAQEVEVVEKGVRSRALALIPLGFGHFLNDRPGLGAAFASSELALGATALGLLLTRNIKYQCSRPNGGLGGDSLACRPPGGKDTFSDADRRELTAIRDAEQSFAWLFLGTVLSDIIVSQILFRPESTLRSRRIPRAELEAENGADPPPPRRSRDDQRGARLRWRPSGAATPRGASFGLRLDF